MPARRRMLAASCLAAAAAIGLALAPTRSQSAGATFYKQVNLVSSTASIPTPNPPDTDLVNPWGIAFSPSHPFWISDNHSGKSTLYDGTGAKQGLVVTIPGPGGVGQGSPTGIVFGAPPAFNGDFFIFATEDGTIAGWKPPSSDASIEKDNSASGAVYKGLALATPPGTTTPQLYAADFHNAKIDVFDGTFQPVSASFKDPHKPKGYAPFNITSINGQLFVTYAKQDAGGHDDVGGPGNGFIDVFTTAGKFVKRFASGKSVSPGGRKELNSPWGLAVAPATFGQFKNALLVGNFGSGQIAAFSLKGKFLGVLRGTDHKTLAIPGLWALIFGAGGQSGDPNKLYFSAGPNDENDGIFGDIEVP